jgi:tetraacyldisaccharide 4'-kinase
MKNTRIILAFILLPLSLLYGIIVFVRNKLYDLNIFSSRSFNIPLISVGNITAGGTGKTPHIEYLANLMKQEFNVATISRGYKRRSKGFKMVHNNSTAKSVGDEPLQIKRKYPDLKVAVDEKRVRGIETLVNKYTDLNLVLLDDAYQHRSVKVNLSILLIDYNHPINKDFLLPMGNLREQAYEKRRADIIIFTKCPPDLQPIKRNILLKQLKPYPYQNVFFTTLEYGEVQPVFGNTSETGDINEYSTKADKNTNLLLVSGIADPHLFKNHIKRNISDQVYSLRFSDHRFFSGKDIEKIQRRFDKIKDKKAIITTEKDAIRLREAPNLSENLKQHLWFIPIRVKFLNDRTKDFNKQIIEYVKKNKSHSFLYPK